LLHELADAVVAIARAFIRRFKAGLRDYRRPVTGGTATVFLFYDVLNA
jgi:hypothetical protein